MRLSHAAPGYLNPGTREGLAPITRLRATECTDELPQGKAFQTGQGPGERGEMGRSWGEGAGGVAGAVEYFSYSCALQSERH